jgi:nucleotide-binding universal stress UspA family protein
MKKILVPTDFSSFGKIAENAALSIAKKANASVDFLHLMDIPKFLSQSATAKPELPEEMKAAIGQAHQYMNELNKNATDKGLNAKTFISETSGIDVLKNHVKQHEIDLVIMGSHGASGLKEAFLGSNTQKVLRTVSAPVLVVKNAIPENFSDIVFASTFKEDVHKAFEKVQNFANIFAANIHLLYVNMPYNFEESGISVERMQKFAAQYPGNFFKIHIFNAFDEETGILKFSQANNIDLIATSTHGKSGFIQMLSPSVTESLANHSSLPVLSVNLKQD